MTMSNTYVVRFRVHRTTSTNKSERKLTFDSISRLAVTVSRIEERDNENLKGYYEA
jgi:hypothetical protein